MLYRRVYKLASFPGSPAGNEVIYKQQPVYVGSKSGWMFHATGQPIFLPVLVLHVFVLENLVI